MTAPRREHRLDGLEPDNLLAFLALLGLLRALETVRPDWRPRVRWSVDEPPVRPVLVTPASVDADAVAMAATDGVAALAEALRPFKYERPDARKGSSNASNASRVLAPTATGKKLSKGAVPRRSLAVGSDHFSGLVKRSIRLAIASPTQHPKTPARRFRADLIAALASQSFKDGTSIADTPLKLPSGQMAFVGAIAENIAFGFTADRAKMTLFEPWIYPDESGSLRLSPFEIREYAYRFSDPSDGPARTDRFASALAGLGMACFTFVPSIPWPICTAYVRRNAFSGSLYWPLWRNEACQGWSAAMISAALKHPELVIQSGRKDAFAALGVTQIMEAKRFKLGDQGNYGNFSRASVSWPRQP